MLPTAEGILCLPVTTDLAYLLQISVWQHGAYMLLQSMARVGTDPRIVFTFANVVFKGMASWPPCHIVNNTSYAILERVNGF
jgi:hypothetical protein